MGESMNLSSRVRRAVEELHHSLQNRPAGVMTLLGMVAVLWIAVGDFWIGAHYSISLFYLLPVSVAAWFGNMRSATLVAGTAAGAFFVADWATTAASSLHLASRYWNTAMLLLTMGLLVALLGSLKELQQRLRLAVEGRTALWRREMDERGRTQEALRQSEQRSSALVQAAADGIILIDAAGLIVEFNAAAERIFGYTRAAVIGRRMAEALVPPATATGASRDLPAFDMEEETSPSGRFDITATRANGESFPLEITLSPLSTAGQSMFAVFVRDLTEQRQAEAALRNSERTLRLISRNASDLILAMDLQGQVLYANPAVESALGYPADRATESAYRSWIHPEDRDRIQALRNELFSGGSYTDVTLRLRTHSGEYRWFSSTWGVLQDERGRLIGVQGRERDTTDLKRLETEIFQIGSRERRQIGHELHDGLGQQLTGIAFRAKTLEEVLHGDANPHTEHAAELVQLINHVISQTRSIARGLDPVRIEGNDLTAALRQLAAETQKIFGINCLLQTDLDHCKLPADASIALYRIAQQALTNSVQHGHAQNTIIELESLDGHLTLRVRDDGCGFDSRVAREEGMGLRIMEHRVRSVCGTLTVRSEPGQGTEIACHIPRSLLANKLDAS
jgi:PAS domain S-box-containing protein